MTRCKSRLPLKPLDRIAPLHSAKRSVSVSRQAPHAVVGDPRRDLARLDKLVRKRYTYAIAYPT